MRERGAPAGGGGGTACAGLGSAAIGCTCPSPLLPLAAGCCASRPRRLGRAPHHQPPPPPPPQVPLTAAPAPWGAVPPLPLPSGCCPRWPVSHTPARGVSLLHTLGSVPCLPPSAKGRLQPKAFGTFPHLGLHLVQLRSRDPCVAGRHPRSPGWCSITRARLRQPRVPVCSRGTI